MRNQPPRNQFWLSFICLIALVFSSGFTPGLAHPSSASPNLKIHLERLTDEPWLNLSAIQPAGEPLTDSPGIEAASLRALSLAAADLNGDQAPELFAGYAAPSGGFLAIYPGNPDPSAPSPFLSQPVALDLPHAPTWLGSGDFNADGYTDLLAAGQGVAELSLLPGYGAGSLAASQSMPLPAGVTALAVGELDRQDGLADFAVGLDNGQVLVFGGEAGAPALRRTLTLPAPAAAMAIGQLDEHFAYDLAITSGKDLFILHGQDQLAGDDLTSAQLDVIKLDCAAIDIALGDFHAPDSQMTEIAVLASDGSLHLFDRQGQALSDSALAQVRASQATPGARLLRAKTSTLPGDDLLVLDPAGGTIGYFNATLTGTTTGSAQLAALNTSSPQAALVLRLNGDALSDLVFLSDASPVPHYAVTDPVRVFEVNGEFWDVDDEDPGDGVCETLSWLDGRHCNLRAAIQEANASAGLDEIRLGFVTSPSEALPPITEALILTGTMTAGQLNAEINGSSAGQSYGLHFTSAASTVQDLKIRGFMQAAVYLQTGGDHLFDNIQVGGGNLNDGISIETDNNTIIYSTIVGNSGDGIAIYGGANNIIRNNWIGVTASGAASGNQSSGIYLHDAENTAIGNVASTRNVISGNYNGGIQISGGSAGTVVQSNYIGLKGDGTTALGNDGIGGVEIGFTSSTTLGGASTAYRNTISANRLGVTVTGNAATGTVIRNNYFGLTAAGEGGPGNLTHAVKLYTTASSSSVQVRDNVLAGSPNTGHGILISNSVSPAQCIAHTIRDNIIGTNAARNVAHGFGQDGIHIEDVDCVTLTANSIRNNTDDGIEVSGEPEVNATLNENNAAANATGFEINTSFNTLNDNSASINFNGVVVNGDGNTLTNTAATFNTNTGMVIFGDDNYIVGPGNDSAAFYANSFEGLVLAGDLNTVTRTHIYNNNLAGVRVIGDDNVIGDTSLGNWINGNGYGVQIEAEADRTRLTDNFIGLAADGETPAGNGLANVLIHGTNSTIGSINAGNVIADAPVGILIQDGSSGSNIRYNRIGTNAGGDAGLPNTTGIKIESGSDNNITDNQIAYNGDGVIVQQGTGNRITANQIYNSTRLAIDLYPAGVTINDTGDTDSGANDLQNYPVITAAGNSGTESLVHANFTGTPNTAYDFDFYSTPYCDPSGHGEATVHVGHANWTTDLNGEYNTILLVSPLTLNEYVSATATDPDGNTSELSPCVKVGVLGGSQTFMVNIENDAVDADIDDGICDSDLSDPGEQCTLRAAIQQANQNSGPNTILLYAGNYQISRSGTDNTAENGDLDITGDLTLIGAGAHLTGVNGNSRDRVFEVRSPASVSISGVRIYGGYLASSAGGGILVNSGAALELDGVTVQYNFAQTAASGGGIYNQGTLNVTNSAVVSNYAGGNGGGFWQWGGTSTWLNATFSGNTASGHGGAIAAESSGSVNLSNVTITNNMADYNNTGDDGGGIYQSGATVTLQNSIVAQNMDRSAEGYPNGHADCAGTLWSTGYNLIGDQAKLDNADIPGCLVSVGTGDSIGGYWIMSNYLTFYAGLEPALELNGGTTLSHSPIASASGMSVDWGNPGAPGTGGGTCEAFDQRGQPRPIDGGVDGIAECDRGAVELIPVTIGVNDVTVPEGAVAEFEVSISDSIQIEFTVDYTVGGLTATPGSDFMPVSGTLTFAAGETSKLVPVNTLTDTYDEPDETFQIELSSAQYVLIADGVGTGVIQDDSPQPAVLVGDASVTEGGPGETTTATFAVTLNSPSGNPVSVAYYLQDGSAIAGDDYTAANGTLTFSPGQTSQSLTVTVLGDNLQEGTETFAVQLVDPVNATINDTGTGTIVDDDVPSFSVNDARAIEGDSGVKEMYFYVFLSQPSTTTLNVSFQTTPGSADTGSDFQNRNGTLSFAPGETVKTITVNIVGDTLEEDQETFTVGLNTPTGGAVIGDGSAAGTIVDNDGEDPPPPETYLYLPLLRH